MATLNHAFTVNRLDLLSEVVAVGRDIDVLQRQFGTRSDLAELRQRQQRVILAVLRQLLALLTTDAETAH